MGSGSGSGPGPGVGRTPQGTRRAAPQGNRKALRLATGFVHAIKLSALAGVSRLPHCKPREIPSAASQRAGNAVNRLKLCIEECHAYSAWQTASGMPPHPARHLSPTGAMPVRHTNPASPWIKPLSPQLIETSRPTSSVSPQRWWTTTSTAADLCQWSDDSRPSRPDDAQAIAATCRIPLITGSGASSSQYTPRLSPARRASASTEDPRFSRKRKGGESIISFRRRAEPSPELPS